MVWQFYKTRSVRNRKAEREERERKTHRGRLLLLSIKSSVYTFQLVQVECKTCFIGARYIPGVAIESCRYLDLAAGRGNTVAGLLRRRDADSARRRRR